MKKNPNITNVATKVAFNAKTTEIENKITLASSFITTPEFNRLTKLTFDRRMKKKTKSLPTESETKSELNLRDTNIEKMKILKCMIQIISFLKVILKYFKTPFNNYGNIVWKSKGLLEKSINPPVT